MGANALDDFNDNDEYDPPCDNQSCNWEYWGDGIWYCRFCNATKAE